MAVIKWLASPADYLSVWRDMRDYTNLRGADTPDEIWLCEHAPVYTLGQAGSPGHVLNPAGIPIVHCDRGGQVTYHGPGQVMAYALFDLRRVDMYVKEYVTLLEGAVIDTLAEAGVAGAAASPARRACMCRIPMAAASWPRSPRWASRSATAAPITGCR